MNEVIASILDAEKKAEEIVKNAAEKAKAIRANADGDGEKIKNGAVAVFKVHRTSSLRDAEKAAEGEYLAVFNEGKTKADEIAESVSTKFDSFADEVVKGITG
ncbi:MAG: hypothetical protein J5911_01910 [Clostridia bacterium]|nr:hypothetical protein [Clostridia bacterium]